VDSTTHFALIPEWILYKASPLAVKLYAILDRHSNKESGKCIPRLKTLAEEMRVSEPTVKRAAAELKRIGAIVVDRRLREDGSQASNQYWLRRDPPDTPATPPRGSSVDPHEPEKTEEPEKASSVSSSFRGAGIPLTVSRKIVTDEEALLAVEILAAFNEQFGTDYRGRDHLIGIIGRLRERPDLRLGDYRELIDKLSKLTWWRKASEGGTLDHPTPRHIFGSGAALDAVVNAKVPAQDQSESDLTIYDT
jgi:GntR family transcriptional regulator